ncbi:MAG: glycosyl hydrolase family 17 protein [Bacteroidia bacterium]
MGIFACSDPKEMKTRRDKHPQEILGNSNFQAISYGGYRGLSRDTQPTLDELKEDLLLMYAAGFRILRTYNVHFPHAENTLRAIKQLKTENDEFEMYVMLGAWISCQAAFTELPNHQFENVANEDEVKEAVRLTKEYPDIVKIMAIGNEAMVHWATSYFVEPGIILKYVDQLQEMKSKGELPENLWVTSSDNFASWGGGSEDYHKEDLNALIKAVDYLSVHTYPFHDTHYSPVFWHSNDSSASKTEDIENAMNRAVDYAKQQYLSVLEYTRKLGVEKPIHIGETGWASVSQGLYGDNGSHAADEYKQALYYQKIRDWTNKDSISCFYFEAFDEQWKDSNHTDGSENHFGLFTLDGQAKLTLWPMVDKGIFDGLSRNGNAIGKTFNGDKDSILNYILRPIKR